MKNGRRMLILRANQLFHDLKGEAYGHEHPEIFEREGERWLRLLDTHLLQNSPHQRTYVDIGAGTGFVGSLLQPFLRPHDMLICADISQVMLACCEKRLKPKDRQYFFSLLTMRDERLDIPDASIDVVTLNSVLHHMPAPDILLQEIQRIMKPGGFIFISHEPNMRFFRNCFLTLQANVRHHCTPRRLAARVLKIVGLYDRVVPQHADADGVFDQVNTTLLAEGLIAAPLAEHELSTLIDAHSPTAGGLRRHEGFDPWALWDTGQTSPALIACETYEYLPKHKGESSPILRGFDALLKWLFPRSGMTFSAVFRASSARV